MTNRTYIGTVDTAYYQACFNREIHVTFRDGSKKKFKALYYDAALDFFEENAYEPCEWFFNYRGEMFITIK